MQPSHDPQRVASPVVSFSVETDLGHPWTKECMKAEGRVLVHPLLVLEPGVRRPGAEIERPDSLPEFSGINRDQQGHQYANINNSSAFIRIPTFQRCGRLLCQLCQLCQLVVTET